MLVVLAACGGAGASSPPDPKLCAAKAVWTGGNDGSSRMHPGSACMSCHQGQEDAPAFTIAGTVYQKQKELTDCNGANGAPSQGAGALSVVVTDAMGAVITMPVNDVGNFYSRQPFVAPFKAKVVTASGHANEMTDAQANGDCNTCHSSIGASGAPGRILAPAP